MDPLHFHNELEKQNTFPNVDRTILIGRLQINL